MSYESIATKIKKYKSGYVNGECRSSEYEARIKQEKALHAKLDLADTMFNELPFTFNMNQKDQVKMLITNYKNFNKLHTKASNEEIILSFIFYIKMQEDETIRIDNNKRLLKKFIKPQKIDLFHNTFEIILCKLISEYFKNVPILPREPKHIDHNLLYKGKYVK